MSDRQNGPALADRVAFVTGANSGIGREIPLTLAEEGARVVLAAGREAKLKQVAVEVRNRGAECLVVPTDAPQEEQVVAMVGQAGVLNLFRACSLAAMMALLLLLMGLSRERTARQAIDTG